MAYTVTPTPTLNAYVQTNLRQVDFTGEPIVKNFLLYNANNAARYQEAMQAYESISQPGIASASVSQKLIVSSQNTTAGSGGAFPKSGDVLILAFTREHPVSSMAGTILTAEFAIIGPHDDIVGTPVEGEPLAPVMVRGVAFSAAADRTEELGALVDWLEDALVVTILKTRYPGDWTYSAAKTRFASLIKQYDTLSVS